MKPFPVLAVALFAVATSAKATIQSTATGSERAEVVFIDPVKFTDVRDGYTGTDAGRDAILDQLRRFMVDQAQTRIPTGEKLIISVTDVDLAGEFEPWLGPQWDDVRIVKDIYPPRMTFDYRLVDHRGKILKDGHRDLTDLAFMTSIALEFRDDPLRYEKTMLRDWFRREFPPAK